jgi:flagellar protein FliO/FliZ
VSPLLALASLVLAAEDDPAGKIESFDYTGQILQVVVALVAICIVFLIVIRWLLPRMARAAGGQGFRMGGGRLVRIVDRCPLEPKRTVFLVEVAGRYMLIGSSEGSVTKIAGGDLDEPEIRRLLGAPPTRTFASLLKKVGRGQSDAQTNAD